MLRIEDSKKESEGIRAKRPVALAGIRRLFVRNGIHRNGLSIATDWRLADCYVSEVAIDHSNDKACRSREM